MSRMNGHQVRGFLDGFNIGNWSTVAAMEKWVTDSRTLPVGTVVTVRTRGVSPDTTYTKASQT